MGEQPEKNNEKMKVMKEILMARREKTTGRGEEKAVEQTIGNSKANNPIIRVPYGLLTPIKRPGYNESRF